MVRTLPRVVIGIILALLGPLAHPGRARAQPGVTIEGKVVGDSGQPIPGVSIGAADPLASSAADFADSTQSDGSFRLTVPPAVYVVTADPLPPLRLTQVRVDARAGNITGLVIQVSARPAPFTPDIPPRASLIQVSAPNAAGDVTVTGSPGAVPAGSFVILVTLETGHATAAQAGADGSFSAPLFAPPGSSVLVKADPLGVGAGRLVRESVLAPLQSTPTSLSSLPGAIVRVGDPPAAGPGVPFGGAGLTRFADVGQSPLPAWTFQGTINGQALAPGDTLRVQGTLRILSAALQRAGAMQADAALSLQRLAGPDGLGGLAHSSYASTFMTPTGFPIERLPQVTNAGLDQFASLALGKVAADRAEAAVDLSLRLPPNLPAGFYRPLISFDFTNVPVEFPPGRLVLNIDRAGRRPINTTYLPTVRVGSPAPARLFWTLLTDTPSNGTRGTRAIEDRDRFGIAPRILTQSETFIVPRFAPASGQPLTYRLEPFAPTVGLGDQAPPNPPLIPFRFPSGRLTVRVRKPDGSVDVLGPAPFVQARMNSLADRNGFLLDGGGGHITDVYQLSTLDPRFEVQFTQDGRHVITLDGSIEDLWGSTWIGGGTYEVHVARLLSLDTAVLPGTPFEVGDGLSPGVVLSPPVPADVEVRFRLAPNSDATRMVERVVKGRANRFGYFQPLASGIPLDQPGEYRVDVTASFRDEAGALWMGARTWGGVVAPREPGIIAHGRRGIDSQRSIGPQWFFRRQIGIPIGGNHVPFPFNSGDITWQQKSDAAIPLVTIQDPSGSLASLLRARALDASGQFQNVPLTPPGTFDERAAVGEVPLFSSRPDGADPHLDPSRVDVWGYTYRSVQRPLVRVREEIGEDDLPPLYWRFSEQYGGQIGVGQNGDLPNEIKFQYGAVVLRGPAVGQPRYAIYGSLLVLVPDNDARGGTRTFPPFQGNGGGPSGGPILTLKGREIDLLFHPTGVRPGTVLEVGDVFAIAGAVGPPLPALVAYTITLPSGRRLEFRGRANKVGYYYRPEDDLVVTEPGLYAVDLRVTYDGLTSAGPVSPPFPTGDVLGTASGRFWVYVVPRGSRPLDVPLPRTTFLPPPASFDVAAGAPGGISATRAHLTAMMPGFLLDTRELTPGATLAYRYDPVTLARDFPNLDVEFGGRPDAADVVTLSLFAAGTQADGSPAFAARVLALHGQELLNLPPPPTRATVSLTTSRPAVRAGDLLTVSASAAASAAVGGDAILALRLADGRTLLYWTGTAFTPSPTPLARGLSLPAGATVGPIPLLTLPIPPGVPPGTYTWLLTLTEAANPGAILAVAAADISVVP